MVKGKIVPKGEEQVDRRRFLGLPEGEGDRGGIKNKEDGSSFEGRSKGCISGS